MLESDGRASRDTRFRGGIHDQDRHRRRHRATRASSCCGCSRSIRRRTCARSPRARMRARASPTCFRACAGATTSRSPTRPTPTSRPATSCSSRRRTAWRWRRRASSSTRGRRGSSISRPISGSRTPRCSSSGTACRTPVPTCSPNRSTACPRSTATRSASARIVGNPGCYPTAVQLGFLPLLEAGVVDAAHLIADCKSGVSGAGRKAEIGLLFAEAADNFKAYGVKGHRHHPGDRAGPARARPDRRSSSSSRRT